jgi:hypothetical protein
MPIMLKPEAGELDQDVIVVSDENGSQFATPFFGG